MWNLGLIPLECSCCEAFIGVNEHGPRQRFLTLSGIARFFNNPFLYQPYIPYACGMDSAGLRNAFRTHTEYEVGVVFLKIVHTGSCIPVIVYTGYLLFLKVYTLRVPYS